MFFRLFDDYLFERRRSYAARRAFSMGCIPTIGFEARGARPIAGEFQTITGRLHVGYRQVRQNLEAKTSGVKTL
jgi:hypothetical protein